MSAMNEDYWFPWYPVHYQRKTLRLSLAEDGAYRRLIDAYMQHGCGVDADERSIARLIGCGVEEWRTVAPAVLAYFELRDGKLYHERCDEELEVQEAHARATSEQRREAANSRWQKKKRKNAGRNAKHERAASDPQSEPDANTMRRDATEQDSTVEDSKNPPPPSGAPPLADAAARESVSRETEPPLDLLADDEFDVPPDLRPANAKGTRIPPDWTPGERGIAFCRDLGWPDERIDRTAAQFRDYWTAKTGKDATKQDWLATWRVWCRKDEDFRGGRAASPSRPRGASQMDRAFERMDRAVLGGAR